MQIVHFNKYIIVRMDDICPTMDMVKFNRFKTLFDSLNIKPLLGIVPENQDSDLMVCEENHEFWALMKILQNEGWCLSMHGVYHKNIHSDDDTKGKSEFVGLSYGEQLKNLTYGYEILCSHGITTNILMPPYHSYDENTLKAIHELGFKYLSDGKSLRPYYLDGIKCIPAFHAWKFKQFGILTICVHSNVESEKSVNDIASFLKENQSRIISFQDACGLKTIPLKTAQVQEKISMAAVGGVMRASSLLKKLVNNKPG